MKTVLVTGATGFIGQHTVRPLIEKGYSVHAISTTPAPRLEPDVHWHGYDMLRDGGHDDLLAEIRPTHLLHLAWYTKHRVCYAAPINLEWVAASLQLLLSFQQHGGERVVVAGTCAEYDWDYGFCSETLTPTRPATLYGKAKDALRRLVEGLAQETGLSAAWARVFFVYGPFEDPNRLVSSVTRSLIDGRPVLCTHGEQLRDFLHVQDVADALVQLLDSDVTGSVNVGSGVPVTVKGVVQEIARQIAGEHTIHYGAVPFDPSEPPLLVADNRRLTQEVGWKPAYSLAAGLDDSIKWWRA